MAYSRQITLAFTGASGAPYSLRLLQCLVEADCQVHLLISSAAKVVFATEEKLQLPGSPEKTAEYFTTLFNAKPGQIKCYGKEEWFSPVASGSAAPKSMVVCPCSTSTLSALAIGASNTLIERAGDVVMKEKGQLILLLREMPLSSIHLQNMLTLSQNGVTVMPASPGFYQNPESVQDLVDFVVARILDHLDIEQTMMPKWGYQTN